MTLKKIISNFCNRSHTSHSITSIDCWVFISHAVFLSQQNLIIFSNALSAKKKKRLCPQVPYKENYEK